MISSEKAAKRNVANRPLARDVIRVAGYLTYLETQFVAAICGLVGDCNTLQSSKLRHSAWHTPSGLAGDAWQPGFVCRLAGAQIHFQTGKICCWFFGHGILHCYLLDVSDLSQRVCHQSRLQLMSHLGGAGHFAPAVGIVSATRLFSSLDDDTDETLSLCSLMT